VRNEHSLAVGSQGQLRSHQLYTTLTRAEARLALLRAKLERSAACRDQAKRDRPRLRRGSLQIGVHPSRTRALPPRPTGATGSWRPMNS